MVNQWLTYLLFFKFSFSELWLCFLKGSSEKQKALKSYRCLVLSLTAIMTGTHQLVFKYVNVRWVGNLLVQCDWRSMTAPVERTNSVCMKIADDYRLYTCEHQQTRQGLTLRPVQLYTNWYSPINHHHTRYRIQPHTFSHERLRRTVN